MKPPFPAGAFRAGFCCGLGPESESTGMEVPFEDLPESDLIVDCVYKGGAASNLKGEVLSKLIPGSPNLGGFRKIYCKENKSKIAYVVLFTTMSELEWPDFLDVETGVFRYYGDNRHPGKTLKDTARKGNALLEEVFRKLNSGQQSEIPPFLIFKREGTGKDMKFLGLAAPGVASLSPDRELVAFWRTFQGERFQNYEAYFSILDTGRLPVSKAWLGALWLDDPHSIDLAPAAWREFIRKGRQGLVTLKAPRIKTCPKPFEQLQSDAEGLQCLDIIRDRYQDDPYGFEYCATDIVSKLDPHFVNFVLTRPWRDGGRDAIGKYQISTGGTVNPPIMMDCALEAKCYGTKHGVGVHEMSRLISRIRYRQFGVMVTTGFISEQAYKEVVEDGHPILMLTATDIASVLRANSIASADVPAWLDSLTAKYHRMSL